MSPGALALAVLLHVAAALALWWMTVNRPVVAPAEEAIEVTIEKPKPPDPPPQPPKAEPKPQPQAKPKPEPMPPLQGLPPPAEITADKRSQVAPSGDQAKDAAGPPPPSLDVPVPQPQPPIQEAMAEPPKPKEPLPPPLEQAVPPAPSPAPAVTSLAPPSKEPALPPVAPKPPPQAPAVAAVPPAPPKPQTPPVVTPQPQPRPSPLIARPQERPPAIANRGTPPSSSPLVNPADVRNRALASENYIWQNARKFSFFIDEQARQYFVTLRVVIARDGRVLAVDVAQSSGTTAIDQAILAGVRRNSPYLPLPPEIAGDQATFLVPLSTLRVRY